MKILVLAGTAEATALARILVARPDTDVVASLARGTTTTDLPCPVRIGGFGAVEGLVEALHAGGIDALVDATHPFATTMSEHAVAAAAAADVPLVRLLRPAWRPLPRDDWRDAADLDDAARCVRTLGARRVLLTIGRMHLARFSALDDVHLVVRSIDPPSPARHDVTVVLGRGPFSVDDERHLLDDHHIDTLVTRNSGGSRAKLDAARDAGVRVVMIGRPRPPEAHMVESVDAAVAWLSSRQADRATNGQSAQ